MSTLGPLVYTIMSESFSGPGLRLEADEFGVCTFYVPSRGYGFLTIPRELEIELVKDTLFWSDFNKKKKKGKLSSSPIVVFRLHKLTGMLHVPVRPMLTDRFCPEFWILKAVYVNNIYYTSSLCH